MPRSRALRHRVIRIGFVASLLALGCTGPAWAQTPAQAPAKPEPLATVPASSDAAPFDASSFWRQFRHGVAVVDGVRLHYVEGGSGPPVLLLPGWPESWYAWRLVMPALAASGRRVIALDPRGYGDSDHPASSYDMATTAAEVHALIGQMGLATDGRLDVVGHDLGTWIAYALAADWPGDVRRLVLSEALLPGVSPPAPPGFPSHEANIRTWHFGFNRLDDLPEILVQGHERAYLSWLFHNKSTRSWAIGDADLDEYVRVFTLPGSARAAFSYYRAQFSPDGLAQSRARASRKLPMPILAIGAENGVGDGLLNTMQAVANDVRGGTVAGCGHYIIEECPQAMVEQVGRFLAE